MTRAAFAVLALLVGTTASAAQDRVAVSPRAAATKDLTGYWVSVITGENWHLRMLVPPKGQFSMIPLNAEGRRVADAWDAKTASAADQCKGYGAANIMRVPGRLRIDWVDDHTLRLDTDSGTQTRSLRFSGSKQPAAQPGQWQGQSTAVWDDGGARAAGHTPPDTLLKVTTTGMRPGHLRKNGVPYSGKATLEEFFDVFSEPNGDTWLVVTSIVTDPQYLTRPYVSVAHFKKLADRSGWDPTPCRADEAR